ncbi:MAG: protein kinase [Planctomycetota bacterium]|nr:protein kinase [Planctomycetota bacterium]
MFGRYKIISRVGSGGMGAVYKAHDTAKNIVVAVKVIHPHIAEIKQFIGRFHQEAKLLEKLAHPKVVRIYDSGVIEGHHYIAMEFVSGRSLTKLMNELSLSSEGGDLRFKPFPEEAVLRILEQMGRVLQEAAELGVVHRDIKPDNIVVTDEEKWDIKLLDFGIAKDTAELHTMLSQTGQVMGTPAYMSPEQCEGRKLDIRSDLYSLGVMAYQCASGRLPFEGPTTMAYIKQHLFEEPQLLSDLNPSLSKGIVAVIHKLLKKLPEERYQVPLDLLEDLNRVRRGEAPRFASDTEAETVPRTPAIGTFGTLDTPTFKTKVGTATQVEKPSKKVGLYIGVAIVAVVVFLTATYFSLSQGKSDTQKEREEGKEREKPIKEKVSEKRAEWKRRFTEALRKEELETAANLLDSLDEEFPENERKDEIKRFLTLVSRVVDEAKERSGDYERLRSINGLLAGLETSEETMRLREMVSRKMQYIEVMRSAEEALKKDEIEAARQGIEKAKSLFETDAVRQLEALLEKKEKALKERERNKEWEEMVRKGDSAVARGDFKAAEASYKAALEIKEDIEVSRKYRQVKDELRYVNLFAEGERKIGERCYEEAVKFLKEASEIRKTEELDAALRFAEFAAGGLNLFGKEDYVRASTYLENALQYREDKRLRKTLLVAKARSGDWWRMLSESTYKTHAHKDELRGIVFFNDNNLVSVGDDGKLLVFETSELGAGERLKCIAQLGVSEGRPLSVAAAKGTIAVGTTTGCVKIYKWDGRQIEETKSISAHSSWVRAITLSSDSSLLVSGDYDGYICVIDVASGVVKRRIETKSGWLYALKFISEKQVASAGADRQISIWDVESGERKSVLSGHIGVVWALDVSKDGRKILSSANDGSVCLWGIGLDTSVARLLNKSQFKENVRAVYLDRYSDTALCSTDSELLVIDVKNGGVLRKFNESDVTTIAVSSNYEFALGKRNGSVVILELGEKRR